MKVKPGQPKSKLVKKSLSGAIQKKKFSKPTGGVLKNVVKITDAFEDLKAGKDLIGISCSKEPKVVKKTASKAPKKAKKTDIKISEDSIDSVKKKSKKPVVASVQKKVKTEIVDGTAKISLKSKLLESSSATEVNIDDNDPKLDITKVNCEVYLYSYIFLN